MQYPWAVPGRKVMCICEFSHDGYPVEIFPRMGEVYTIRNVVCYSDEEGIGLQFVEIKNTQRGYLGKVTECAFMIDGFKPLTDISKLEELLNKAPTPELEDA